MKCARRSKQLNPLLIIRVTRLKGRILCSCIYAYERERERERKQRADATGEAFSGERTPLTRTLAAAAAITGPGCGANRE